MILRRGNVTKVYQRLIEVKLKNPEQDIVNVVPVHGLDTDERTETEYIKEGTEVLVLIDNHNVAYAIGSTSEGYADVLAELIKRIENEEVQINAKNIRLVGFDGSDVANLIHSKAMKYEILNSAGTNLIDTMMKLAEGLALYFPAEEFASEAMADLVIFKAGAEATLTELEENPHEF